MNTENSNNDKKKQWWALMLFDTEINLGISDKPNRWFNYHTETFDNGFNALNAYANTPCPASKLIGPTNSEDELAYKSAEMIENYQNEQWLNENLYPFI